MNKMRELCVHDMEKKHPNTKWFNDEVFRAFILDFEGIAEGFSSWAAFDAVIKRLYGDADTFRIEFKKAEGI
jgi:hypothetical protein